MTQSIFGFRMGGKGIVSVLIIAGIFLIGANINVIAGQLAVWGGVCIGLVLGALGILGVMNRLI